VFYFAWQDDGLSVFSPAMHVVDEDVFAFKLSHDENDYARLDIDIRNPRVGLLSPARKQWAWLAWRKPDDSVVPLFHGRLVGVPEGLSEEIFTLTFTARAADNDDQKAALAQSLRVLPYFDPVFLDPARIRDPDTVLEARSALWHYGRTDKTLTISDIVDGEDGTLELAGEDIFSLDYSFSGEPLRAVEVSAEVSWKQAAAGSVDISAALVAAFQAADSNGPITSYTGEGLARTWPLPGDPIGGGWSFDTSVLNLLSGNGVTETYIDVKLAPISAPPAPPNFIDPDHAGDTTNPLNRARFYKWVFAAQMSVAYDTSRDRSEAISFTVRADVQDLLAESDQPRSTQMRFQSGLVGQPVDDADASDATFTGEALPIGEVLRASYFNQARGRDSVKFLIACARARLLASARAATISAEIEFDKAVTLSCRHNVEVSDARVPGGSARGKVIGYSFGLDGERGELFGSVAIGCAIGRGNPLAPAAEGDPTHSESDYFGADAQVYSGAETVAVAGSIGGIKFSDFQMPAVDDGIDFSQMTPAANILSLVVLNGEGVQREVLELTWPDTKTAVDALNLVPTIVELNLRPVTGGPFRAERGIEVSALVIPRYLDLEAS
jgi:hypothetical protein